MPRTAMTTTDDDIAHGLAPAAVRAAWTHGSSCQLAPPPQQQQLPRSLVARSLARAVSCLLLLQRRGAATKTGALGKRHILRAARPQGEHGLHGLRRRIRCRAQPRPTCATSPSQQQPSIDQFIQPAEGKHDEKAAPPPHHPRRELCARLCPWYGAAAASGVPDERRILWAAYSIAGSRAQFFCCRSLAAAARPSGQVATTHLVVTAGQNNDSAARAPAGGGEKIN